MTHEVVLDTETTSADARVDRIIEVGCVELVSHTQTGRTFHCYINLPKGVHLNALEVCPLSNGAAQESRSAPKPGQLF
ncbi:hypothetical protein MMSR116_05830 [Methylobacterium mesophilicum SR1.6/6]|uniref:Exonuclease domain-containing protein n=1 Tax=Methylobacterium mesophilicum SR1.6/6 TaxID=908290 RepID=A0A6B9FEF2_9HYPH|nr:exonuclease domain-containing protein [Methylobacterium mesophilicum]QGY01473.1 hypothetical protein MMSR116_05830 [Methylobacterium mesophilicum SR1.6/6]